MFYKDCKLFSVG